MFETLTPDGVVSFEKVDRLKRDTFKKPYLTCDLVTKEGVQGPLYEVHLYNVRKVSELHSLSFGMVEKTPVPSPSPIRLVSIEILLRHI